MMPLVSLPPSHLLPLMPSVTPLAGLKAVPPKAARLLSKPQARIAQGEGHPQLSLRSESLPDLCSRGVQSGQLCWGRVGDTPGP